MEETMRRIRLVLTAMIVVGLMGAVQSGCMHKQPPAGTYSDAGLKAFNADAFIVDLTALSQVAVNLNATAGGEHLSDANTRMVRDFALAAGKATDNYGRGTGTLANIKDTYTTLLTDLPADVRINPKLAAALQLIANGLNVIPEE
jgi:hypothetical protein